MAGDSELEKILERRHDKRGKLTMLADKLRAFGRTVYDVRLPLMLASIASGTDRYLTYIGLNSGISYEANPAALAYMNGLGLVPGMIASGVIGMASFAALGKAGDVLSDGKFPRNYLLKASLYGVAVSEAVVSLNNYFVDTSPASNPFNQFTQQYGSGSFADLLLAMPLLVTAGAAVYQSIKQALKKRKCAEKIGASA